MIGSVSIAPLTVAEIFFARIPLIEKLLSKSWSPLYEVIVIEVRLPRVLLAALVGSALAVSGTTMQALFRNPMASPYILGISSGAAFGASLAIVLELSFGTGTYTVSLMAFLFASLVVFLVYEIAKVQRRVPVETLLLTGIAIGSLFSALTSFMLYIAGEKLHRIVFWLMGGLWASSWSKVIVVFPLDLGVEVEKLKKVVLIFASLCTGVAVSVCGIIGFVGLIIPHVMRILVGPDHRVLLPSSCLVGAMFLIWVDTLARTIIEPTEIPVGIITALLGVPFFLYLLRKRKRITGW
jgi:iron complex transport system permease protein